MFKVYSIYILLVFADKVVTLIVIPRGVFETEILY